MGKKTKFTDEEIKMMKEMDKISAKAEANPEISNMRVPDSLWHELQRDIREYNEEKRAKEQAERDKELIKLGLVYERRRKYRKYYVLAATLILALSLGITSFGGAEKIFEMFERRSLGRTQIQINSHTEVERVGDINEEEAYAEIEKEFGHYPVKISYLPKGIWFLESSIHTEMQRAHLLYGTDDEVYINYAIRPNYREGSWGTDIEDKLVKTYEIKNENTIYYVKKYLVEKELDRWLIQFQYKDVSYSMIINGLRENEVEKVLAELYFY